MEIDDKGLVKIDGIDLDVRSELIPALRDDQNSNTEDIEDDGI